MFFMPCHSQTLNKSKSEQNICLKSKKQLLTFLPLDRGKGEAIPPLFPLVLVTCLGPPAGIKPKQVLYIFVMPMF